ncbi:MAG: DNA helicase RecQ [Cyanobacteria bacterium]|nr:DNA helicase RecQ [Cyanobacteriota bacterium]MDW8199821.1 DNA helicase RecQ [Cyanobacteriota bacterium SKYGB_h_bin112]
MATATTDGLEKALKQFFGYDQFRPGQREIVEAALTGQDVLVVMPTGGGKSLCFQLPALVRSGLTIVVSPLIALMQDQVEALQINGIAATFLNSSLSAVESRDRSQAALKGEIKLLYVAPERLLLESFLLDFLGSIQAGVGLTAIAIDEAHCVSEWGHDFRPEYRQLRRLRQIYPQVPIMALTATATERVRQDIISQLDLRQPYCHIASFNRSNLYYEVHPKHRRGNQTFIQLVQQVQQLTGPGIIYCLSRKRVDELTTRLNHHGIADLPYHAGMDNRQRSDNPQRFIRDDVRVMVATIAFGMGINKPDVRFVIHYDLPRNIESYYQESGRAGRDGEPAHCTLYFGLSDIKSIEWLISQKVDPETGEPLVAEQRIAYQQLRQVIAYAESSICRRTIQLGYFGETFAGNCGNCDNCRHPKPLEDWTIDAQKFLSCVARCQERFGVAHIIDVLRGSRSEKVLRHKHEQLSTYGIGKDRQVDEWRLLARTLIQQGLVDETSDGYSILKLNAHSWEVMRKQRQVWIAISKPQALEQPTSKSSTAPELTDPATAGLFQHLRQLRKQLADEQSVPPYVVFSDASLRAMAVERPTTLAAFDCLPGVGRRKLEQYGRLFTDAIRCYCHDHNLETDQRVQAEVVQPTPSSTQLVTLQLFRQGLTVQQIAEQRQLKATTIETHLAELIEQGEAIDLDNLVEPERQAVIRAALETVGASALKPVYEYLQGHYSYGELRLVRAYYQITGELRS